MKARIKYFLLYGLFWLVFFVFARLMFLVYQFDKTSDLDVSDFFLIFLHGIRLDLSTMGYFMLIPGILLSLYTFFSSRVLSVLLNAYTGFLLFIVVFIVVLDMELYSHWGFRLDATPLMYVGKEAAGSGEVLTTILLVSLWFIIFAGFGYSFLKLYSPGIASLKKGSWPTALVLLLLTGSLIGPIRGTTGVAPINTGTVYFHDTNLYANHAAVNVAWNTGYALRKLNQLQYPGNYFDANKTQSYFDLLYPENSTDSPKVINGDKPNVIIIILESYTFKFIEALGGVEGVTPNINRLVREGILFDNFYSSGDRTDKGIVSVLNGYPTQPLTSIIKFPKKTQSLPFLNKDFKAMGYQTEFTYGYNIDYANFRSYLTNARFDHITHSQDFPPELNTSKWGVHDHFVFNKFFDEAQEARQPFFKIMMTQSSHEPFEVPMETVIEGEDEESMFLNSAYYTDKSLGEFIEKAKDTDWWKNSWIIITADHGHYMPGNGGLDNPDRFKIPMLWLGGALNVRDTVIHTYGTQTDIANTVLGQLGRHDREFIFSNDMLSPDYDDFAVFVFNNGFGFLDHDKKIVYDNTGAKYLTREGNVSEQDAELGKAYMQTLFNDFNAR